MDETATTTTKTPETTAKLRALGFCGADDSVDPRLLGLFASAYPLVEFGVLFRPDKEGEPRYPTLAWVERFSYIIHKAQIKAAAHLCGERVNQVLRGEFGFVEQVQQWGFSRVQINATAVNGVDMSQLGQQAPNLLAVAHASPSLEFIVQKNDETRPLWEGLVADTTTRLPPNISMLVDESKGTGVAATSWPVPPKEYDIGYAGGIGPANITDMLAQASKAAEGRSFWMDMESSLRSTKNGKDVFDLDKCYQVMIAVCDAGFMSHPPTLA